MKRLTETGKWRDPWYRKLSPKLQHFWIYLCDSCDCAGVIEIDWELASCEFGQPVSSVDLDGLGSRVQSLPSGKFWIPGFIKFQQRCTELNPKNACHRGILRILALNGIESPLPVANYEKTETHHAAAERSPFVAPSKGLDRATGTSTSTGNSTEKEGGTGGNPQELESSEILNRFNAFWTAYPKKSSVIEAQRAWIESRAYLCFQEIMESLMRQIASDTWTREKGRYIPMPANWIRDMRWKDEPTTPAAPAVPNGQPAPIWKQEKILQEAIDSHPANRGSAHFNQNCTESQKQDLKKYREALRALKEKQIKGITDGH